MTKRQPDLATRMMLEEASLSSNGDYEKSTSLQFSLDFIDRAFESITELVSIRVRFIHSKDNQTLCLRDVDPIACDGVWAIIDDGCNCCSHNSTWRQSTEAKMKVLGLHPILLHKKATPFNGTGRTTKNRKPKIPTGVIFHAVSLSSSHVLLSHDLLSSVQSMPTSSLLTFFFSIRGFGWQWISRTLRTSSPHRTPMNMTQCWNFYVTNIFAYSSRHHMTTIPIGTILDTLTRLSDGCSGFTLFPSQLTCQALHKTEVSSACGTAFTRLFHTRTG